MKTTCLAKGYYQVVIEGQVFTIVQSMRKELWQVFEGRSAADRLLDEFPKFAAAKEFCLNYSKEAV